ncbi:MAG: preprotein translocase subunit SecE [Candidatus Parcubacteria bacterium]|nr:preprotein translocase subunit SecE [Candidatus Parcubacteria bacterium]
MQNFIQYLKDTKGEMKHVNWPTKSQTIAFTSLVILISVTASFLLGVFDAGFRKALEAFLSR